MGGKEHEYNRNQQPRDFENKLQSGELAEGSEQKVPLDGAQKEITQNEQRVKRKPKQTKSIFLETLVEMNRQHIENYTLQRIDNLTLHQKFEVLQKLAEARQVQNVEQFIKQLEERLQSLEELTPLDAAKEARSINGTIKRLIRTTLTYRQKEQTQEATPFMTVEEARSILDKDQERRRKERERSTKRRSEDPEANRQRVKEWREQNREKYNAYMREYKRQRREREKERIEAARQVLDAQSDDLTT